MPHPGDCVSQLSNPGRSSSDLRFLPALLSCAAPHVPDVTTVALNSTPVCRMAAWCGEHSRAQSRSSTRRPVREATGKAWPANLAGRATLCAALVIACGGQAHGQTLEPFAFAQLTAERIGSEDAIGFGADAIRAGFRVRHDRFTARLQLDFNAGDLDERLPGTLPNVIKDIDVVYTLDEQTSVRFGQFKVPLGYDFLLPATGLDVTKRGMEKGLVLERSIGLMLSGRKLGGSFGYDIGLFNPAGRSSATSHVGSGPMDQTGEDLAAAARVSFDPDEHWHAELALGMSQDAGGPGSENYEVIDLALVWRNQPWTLKAEYIDGQNVFGLSGRDERVWYVHAGRALSDKLSAVLRHYDGEHVFAGDQTDLTNTYLGLTWNLDANNAANARFMLNYVIAGGDETNYTGVRGFRRDALFAQFQFDYRR